MAVFGGLARHNLFRFSFLKKNKLLLSFWPEEVWKKFIKDFLKGISEMLSDALVMITKNIRSNHWCLCYVCHTQTGSRACARRLFSRVLFNTPTNLYFMSMVLLLFERTKDVSVRAQAPKPRIIEGRKAETSSTAWRRGLHLKPSSCTMIVSPQSRTLGCTEGRKLKTC